MPRALGIRFVWDPSARIGRMRIIDFQDLTKEDKPVLDRHFSSG